jgi:hypothetical protein
MEDRIGDVGGGADIGQLAQTLTPAGVRVFTMRPAAKAPTMRGTRFLSA